MYIKFACKNLIAMCLQLLDMHYLTGSDMISYFYQLWTLFGRMSVQDSNSVFGDIGATHSDRMEAVQSFVCDSVNEHPRPRINTNYTCVKGESQLG